jgi:hypothetical protein
MEERKIFKFLGKNLKYGLTEDEYNFLYRQYTDRNIDEKCIFCNHVIKKCNLTTHQKTKYCLEQQKKKLDGNERIDDEYVKCKICKKIIRINNIAIHQQRKLCKNAVDEKYCPDKTIKTGKFTVIF